MPRIRFTTLFSERIGGVDSVDIPAATIASALRGLTDRHPELRTLVWKADGAFNPAMIVFHNDRQLTARELDTAVGEHDVIDIIPAIEGGLW